tara:strand:+ start:4570 stop:6495 length:1926 start_codon:yes stop_codon:yes gene_type:complete
MNNKHTPRFLLIGLILIWAIYALYPTYKYESLSEQDKEELKTSGKLIDLESKIIRQGLDLKGGMYIVLEADLPVLIKNLSDIYDDRLENILTTAEKKSNDPDIDFFSAFRQEINDKNIKLARYYHQFGSNQDEIFEGLIEEADDAINRVLEILQNRIDQFGVSEPTIQKQGKHRIIVELAGIQDSERARSLLQSTALLEFFLIKSPSVTNEILVQLDELLLKLKNSGNLELGDEEIFKENIAENETENVSTDNTSSDEALTVSELFGETDSSPNDTIDNNDFQTIGKNPLSDLMVSIGGDLGVDEKNVYAFKKLMSTPEVKSKLNSANSQFLFSNDPELISEGSLQKSIYKVYYTEKSAELTGGVVDEARADLGTLGSGSAGQPVVSLTMNSDGSRTWSRVTGANVGERIAIVLDKKVHMAPSIREKIPSGRTQIEGFSGIDEAKDIAIILRAGALPAPVNIIEERIVGPSLGAESINKGTNAVIIGLSIVLIFMILYYRVAGSIADFALLWNILLVLAVLASLEATLTLPGIAGLILTVGMSIDSNVIIFERIREEIDKGKSPKSAIQTGYDRALSAIIDANVTTVIAALVLYQFGTGPIKGFATVLFWGILISMFTAIYVTRTILNTYTSYKKVAKLSI